MKAKAQGAGAIAPSGGVKDDTMEHTEDQTFEVSDEECVAMVQGVEIPLQAAEVLRKRRKVCGSPI